MKIKHLRMRKVGNKTYYYFDVPLSRPRQLIPLGNRLDQAIAKMTLLQKGDEQPLFQSAASRYFDSTQYQILAPRTKQDYQKYLVPLLKFFDDAPLDQIKPHHIALYLQQSGGQSQKNKHISLFNNIFNYARSTGLTDHQNPAQGVKKNKTKPRSRLITDHEFNQLITNLDDEYLQYVFKFWALIGCRKGDLLSIQVTALDEDIMSFRNGKNGVIQSIKLTDQAFKIVKYLMDKSLNDNLINLRLDQLRYQFDKAKSGDFTMHDIRAYAATKYYKKHGLQLTQKFLGHKQATTTDRYIRKYVGEIVESL